MSSARSRSRHREVHRALARTLVAAPALIAALGGSITMATPAGAATTWEELRQCESGGNYRTNTGNGYYGAYQFSRATWRSLGYIGLPSDASPATQDEAARRLAARSGFGQWPVCGRGMGTDQLVVGAGSSASSAAATNPTHSTVAARRPGRPTRVEGPPGSGRSPFFTTKLINQVRADVHLWQRRMNTLGYNVRTDGQYGPQSASAARHLQAVRGLQVDGICGPQTWAAAFGRRR